MADMARILILGGTAWLGSEIAQQAIAHGDEVTCLARGEAGEVPSGARFVHADRSQPDAYDAVRAQHWDAVVDVSWQPGFVAAAVSALSGSAAHWTYVSSVSVYAQDDQVCTDESAPRVAPLQATSADMAQYAEAKVACEDLVTAGLGDRALLARAGLIVGPGDPTDRFGYWVGRLALAGDADVLVPDEPDLPLQVIDVRDLAAWIATAATRGITGPINAVGEPDRFAHLLPIAAEAAGFTGSLRAAAPGWLAAHDVQYWSGPRSLPLWLPLPDNVGSMTRSDVLARLSGLRQRALAETVRDTLIDERERGLDRPRRAGLTRDEELSLIRELS